MICLDDFHNHGYGLWSPHEHEYITVGQINIYLALEIKQSALQDTLVQLCALIQHTVTDSQFSYTCNLLGYWKDTFYTYNLIFTNKALSTTESSCALYVSI